MHFKSPKVLCSR